MGKLTKKEAKNHLMAMELVNNSLPLTEVEFVSIEIAS